MKEYGRQRGFVINKYQVKYHNYNPSDPNDRIVKKRTFACEYARKYKPIKSKPIEQQHNKGSKKLIVNGTLI